MKHTPTKSSTNILVLSTLFHPEMGGAQRYIEELYANLVKHHANVRVSILTYNTRHAVAEERYRGMTIYRVPCWPILTGQFALPNPFALIKTLKTIVGKSRIQYVHTHLRFFDTAWWGWILARAIGAKAIFTEHVASHPVHTSPIVMAVAKLVDLTIAKWSVEHYDLITTTNTPAKEFLDKTLKIKSPVVVSYGGVDTNLFAPNKYNHKKHIPGVRPLTLPKKSTVITFAGRIIWSKGITYFLDAVTQLMKKTPSTVHFVIAGTGSLEKKVEKYISRNRAGKRVHFLGALTRENMAKLYKYSDIVVHPSHHNEGFPNIILEAGSSGAYVIATDNAGTSEIITHGKTAEFIPMKNHRAIVQAVHTALKNPGMRREATTLCRTTIRQKFDWSSISETFFHLMESTNAAALSGENDYDARISRITRSIFGTLDKLWGGTIL